MYDSIPWELATSTVSSFSSPMLGRTVYYGVNLMLQDPRETVVCKDPPDRRVLLVLRAE